MNAIQHASLLRVIYQDLVRFRGLLFWSLIALISSLGVVYLTHANRELIAERDVLMQARDELDVEWRHLVIEQSALAEHSRIEQLAVRELEMRRVEDEQEVLVPWR